MKRLLARSWERTARCARVGAPRHVAVRATALGASVALAFGLLVGGCRQPPKKVDVFEPPPVETSAPTWVDQPLSWSKLETLEKWLENDAARHEPSLVIEGRLVLNEGRLQFSQRDRATTPADTLRLRIENAREGFAAVKDDPRASAGQKRRAEIGLRASQALLVAPVGQKLAILTRKQWGARNASVPNLTPLKGQWSKITVHHSAETSTDPTGGSQDESATALRAIQRYHMESNGWGDVGYHYLIDAAGRIFEGRELRWQGAHAGGANNAQNIGVCLLGDLERRAPTAAALKSLELLIDDLRQRYKIRTNRLYAHSELNTTTCPGDALTNWIKKHR